MSSVEYLTEFVKERLTAAAEEIFGVFKTTIVQYEQEIDRQRKLLDIVWKPEVKLQRIEIPQQHVCKEEEVHAEQQLSNKDCNSSVIQKEPEPPQIKEEQNGPFTSQEGEQHDTHSLLLTLAHEESDDCDTEPENSHQPLSHNSHVAETQDRMKRKLGGSGSRRVAGSKSKQREIDTNGAKDFKWSRILRNSCVGEKRFKCETCGKVVKHKKTLRKHLRLHTGEKPYSCDTCGKRFNDAQYLKHHMMNHTGERPHTCSRCNKGFNYNSQLRLHMRTHTGERPYLCTICGSRFFVKNTWKRHLSIHTGEKPFTCTTCEFLFEINKVSIYLSIYLTCGKHFRIHYSLKTHMKTHTGEKPHSCQVCGKKYVVKAQLKRHMGLHTREKSRQQKKKSGKRFG